MGHSKGMSMETYISGTAGNDVLTGTPGDDYFDGQSGEDIAVLGVPGVTFRLDANGDLQALGPAGQDTLAGIEVVQLSGGERIGVDNGLAQNEIHVPEEGASAARVESTADGALFLLWENPREEDTNLRIQRLDASGLPLGSVHVIERTMGLWVAGEKITALANGDYLLTWSPVSDDGFSKVVALRLNADLVPQGGVVELTDWGMQQDLADYGVAARSDGGYLLTWQQEIWLEEEGESDYGVASQVFDAAGNPLTNVVNVSHLYDHGISSIQASLLESGNTLVTWRDRHDEAFRFRLLDAQGVPVAGETPIGNSSAGEFDELKTAALAGGGFVLAWDVWSEAQGSRVYVRSYDANGHVLQAEVPVAGLGKEASLGGLVARADGGYLLLWSNADGGFARAYDSAGRAQGVAVSLLVDQIDGVVILGNGDFMLSTGTDVIYTRVYNEDGIAQGRLTLTGDAADNTLTFSDDQVVTLEGAAGNDSLRSGSADDVLQGGSGNDSLNGGQGADRMLGGSGDDTYIVDSQADLVMESADEGYDTVRSSVDFRLGEHVEKLILQGDKVLHGFGNAGDNTLYGNLGNNLLQGEEGNDLLNGQAGMDDMLGGLGDDTYIVDSQGDTIIEGAGEGYDQVKSSVSHTLAEHVEKLMLTGESSINGTGNQAANTLKGNSGDNILRGAGGNDGLYGGLGNDTYLFARGDGVDKISDADASAGNQDWLVFSAAEHDQLWFRKAGNGLEISIIGSGDKVTITDWALGSANQVENIVSGDGLKLNNAQVDSLIEAMAAFAPPAAGQTELPAHYASALDGVIAASWG